MKISRGLNNLWTKGGPAIRTAGSLTSQRPDIMTMSGLFPFGVKAGRG